MSSSRPPEQVYHQDYVARIRYSNALPPPPFPPKLLNIPNDGLTQYTSAGFASRLARGQPPNIEADAELGMPIDMIGIPGIFDGDESCITVTSSTPPALHPLDRALLKPLSALGKPSSRFTDVSFLRRTEYITGGSAALFTNSSAMRDSKRDKVIYKRPVENVNSPANILRKIIKGFNLAYPHDRNFSNTNDTSGIRRDTDSSPAEASAWNQPRHPTNSSLQLVDTYPILPDFAAFPESASYFIMKFQSDPLGQSPESKNRLDVALFHVNEPTPEVMAHYRATQARVDGASPKSTGNDSSPANLFMFDYDLYLPEKDSVNQIKRKFNIYAEDRNDPNLYDYVKSDSQSGAFKYTRIRRYETYQQLGLGGDRPFAESIGISLHDPNSDSPDVKSDLPKAAYIYGISQRSSIRPKRLLKDNSAQSDETSVADVIELTVHEITDSELEQRRSLLEKFSIKPDKRPLLIN